MESIKKNYLLTASYNLIYVLTPLLTTPYISRVLGAEGIGEYASAFSIATVFVMIIRLGLNNYGNRTIAAIRDDKATVSRVFCEIYTMQLMCGVCVSLFYVIWMSLLAPNHFLSMCLMLYVLSAVLDITWLLYGVEDFVITSIRDSFVRLLTVVMVFVFVKNQEDLWIYTLIMSAGFLIGQLLGWFRVGRYIELCKPELKQVIKHFKPNLILFIPTIAVSIYKIMDKIMLGAMTNSTELGFYESSERVINLPVALISALGTVMLPRMSNMIATNKDENEISRIVEKSIVFATFLSTLLCFGLMSVSDMFIPLFYGEGFDKCKTLYMVLLPSCVFLAFANVLRTQVLLPRKKDKEFIISLFTGAVVNLILNVILIPRYASVGAAIATLCAEFSVWFVQLLVARESIDTRKDIFRSLPYIVSGLFMFMIWKDRLINLDVKIVSLIAKVLLCGMTYFVLLGIIMLAERSIQKIPKN